MIKISHGNPTHNNYFPCDPFVLPLSLRLTCTQYIVTNVFVFLGNIAKTDKGLGLETSSIINSDPDLIRNFLISSDTTIERNSLMENVYPKIKEYLRENYGLEFQVSGFNDTQNRTIDAYICIYKEQ